MTMSKLSHVREDGSLVMVDVGCEARDRTDRARRGARTLEPGGCGSAARRDAAEGRCVRRRATRWYHGGKAHRAI